MEIRSPLRIDLAGGTLDCWPVYVLLGKAITLNFPISIYTRVNLEKIEEGIHILCKDLRYEKKFKNLDEVLENSDKELKLIIKVLSYFKPSFPFRLSTLSESPLLGGGLGASSSLCVSLLKAFFELYEDKKRPDLIKLVQLASHLELQTLHYPTGTQDYFPAIEPRFHVLHYGVDGVCSEELKFDFETFKKHILLVNIGIPHQSGLNNWSVLQKVIEKDKKTLDLLKELSCVSESFYDSLKRNDFSKFPKLFEKEYFYRTQLSSSFSVSPIEDLRRLVVKEAECQVKICGAGGGGCVMLWCSLDDKEKVKQICRKNQFQIISAHPLL